ncbi:hypothetical protein FACS1894113_1010 [Alphaproteobacteria bacterium]|nr:hypothetical protein FACS1894113_1010 [Alphaproteobacteria bacterium]
MSFLNIGNSSEIASPDFSYVYLEGFLHNYGDIVANRNVFITESLYSDGNATFNYNLTAKKIKISGEFYLFGDKIITDKIKSKGILKAPKATIFTKKAIISGDISEIYKIEADEVILKNVQQAYLCCNKCTIGENCVIN